MTLLDSHRSSLALIGRALQGALVKQDVLADVDETVGEAAVGFLTSGELSMSTDGLWRPRTPGDAPALASGLTTPEALGFAVAMRWAADTSNAPVIGLAPHGCWRLTLPTGTFGQNLAPADAIPLAMALLAVRRAIRPREPWQARDPVADGLQFHLRSMSAALSPRRAELLLPPTIASDIGRDWSGRYDLPAA
mgnify:FL=1